MFIKSSIVAFTAFAALATAGAASADSSDTVSVKVSYADLNLSSQDGARTMVSRIERAAHHICGDYDHGMGNLQTQTATRACMRDVTNRAAEKLGAPLVTASFGGSKPNATVLAAR